MTAPQQAMDAIEPPRAYESCLRDDEALATSAAPVLVLVSELGHTTYAQAAGRLA